MAQINPPFDGSKPCPMCSTEIRGVSALLHNCLTRWPEGKSFVRLNDLRKFHNDCGKIETDHPVVREMLDVAQALVDACEGMTEEGLSIKWTPDIREKVAALIPRAEQALYNLAPVSDEHWRDNRHSHGDENILREQQGATAIRFLPPKSYHYKVEVVREGADLMHQACGVGLRLDQHFKDNLAKDPKFYGKVWCPRCRINAPSEQFWNANDPGRPVPHHGSGPDNQ